MNKTPFLWQWPCHMYESCQKKTHFYEKRPIKKPCSLIRMSFVRVRCYMCGTYVWHRWCYFTNILTATPHVFQEITYFCEKRSIKEDCSLMYVSFMCVRRCLFDTYAWHRWCYFKYTTMNTPHQKAKTRIKKSQIHLQIILSALPNRCTHLFIG